MKRTIFLPLSILLITAFISQSCKPDEDIAGTPAGGKVGGNDVLNQRFSEFSIVQLDVASLHAQLAAGSKGSFTDLQVANGTATPWTFSVTRNELAPEGVTASSLSGGSDKAGPDGEVFTLEGLAGPDFSGDARLTVTPEFAGGFLTLNGEETFIEPLALYVPGSDPGLVVIYKASDVRSGAEESCADLQVPGGELRSAPDGEGDRPEATCYKLEVRAQGDYYFWRDKVGGNSSLGVYSIMSYLNYSDSKLASVGVDLVVPSGGVTLNTSPESLSNDGATMLGQIRNSWLPKTNLGRDLVVFFTNRDITSGGSSGTVGIAWTGTVCRNASYAFAIVETRTSSFINRVTAHEIGHTLNALHTSSCPGGLMYPIVNHSCTSESFTSTSVSQINSHLSRYNACLGRGTCQ